MDKNYKDFSCNSRFFHMFSLFVPVSAYFVHVYSKYNVDRLVSIEFTLIVRRHVCCEFERARKHGFDIWRLSFCYDITRFLANNACLSAIYSHVRMGTHICLFVSVILVAVDRCSKSSRRWPCWNCRGRSIFVLLILISIF